MCLGGVFGMLSFQDRGTKRFYFICDRDVCTYTVLLLVVVVLSNCGGESSLVLSTRYERLVVWLE